MTRRLVAIIGGGVSGYAAAYELKRTRRQLGVVQVGGPLA